MSEVTLKRYCKQALVSRYLQSCPEEMIEYGDAIMTSEKVLEQVVSGAPIKKPPMLMKPGDLDVPKPKQKSKAKPKTAKAKAEEWTIIT